MIHHNQPNEEATHIDDSSAAMLQAYDELLARGESSDSVALEHAALEDEGLMRARGCIEMLRAAWPPVPGARVDAECPSLRTLGDFRLLREIGCGGMGVVYEAQQISLPRRVAMKVLPFAAILDPRQLERFKNEARAAATLDHPAIVSIYSVGCERGVHFIAMQFVEGRSLAEAIAEVRRGRSGERPAADGVLSTPVEPTEEFGPGHCEMAVPQAEKETVGRALDGTDPIRSPGLSSIWRSLPAGELTQSRAFIDFAARLGASAAEALDHAHAHGVVHRDVKPGNLLLDAEDRVHVADFGLARIGEDVGITMTGDILGTLRYMSPEQALARRAVVDHRTDIYSLGATLYELITLTALFTGRDRQELLRKIALEEPRPPRKLNTAVPVDLETIVLKAVAKDPIDRYATAKEMADDLRRYLAGKPVEARRIGPTERLWRWSKRNPMVAVLTVAVATLATLVAVVTSIGNMKTTVALAQVSVERDTAQVARRETQQQRDEALVNLYVSNVRLAQQEWENGNLTAVETLLDAHIPTDDQIDLRGWEWHYLKSLCHRDLATLRGHTAGIQTVAWSPNGQRLASAGDDFVVRIWDAATHKELATWSGHSNRIGSLAWSPDGSQIVSTGWDKTVRVWNVATGETVFEITANEKILRQVTWSPDGLRLASCGDHGLVKVWDAKTGKELMQMKGHSLLWSLAWSPDGNRLASVGNYGNADIQIWDAGTGEQIKQILNAHGHAIADVAWSPDGRQLATASKDQTMRIWDAETGERRQRIDAHDGAVISVSWSPDGAELATSGGDGIVKVWSAGDGRLLNVLRGHLGSVPSVEWRADGKQLASGSRDSTVKVWDPHQEQLFTTVYGRGGFSWSPDGRRLATVIGPSSMLQVMEMDSSVVQQLPFPHSDEFTIGGRIAWSPGGSRIACSAHASDTSAFVAKVFDRATLAEIYSLEVPHQSDFQEIRSIAWSPDERYLAAANFDGLVDGYVIIWEMVTGEEVVRLKQHGPVDSVAWCPDGTRVASSSWCQIVKIWEVGTWREILNLNCHPDVLGAAAGGEYKVAWTPDGSQLAAGTVRGWVIMWDASTGREVLSFRAHTAGIRSIAISPDGLRIATASTDKSVKIWDTAGRQLLTLRGHDKRVSSVAWSPSGAWLISSGGGLRIWGGSREMGETD